MIAGPELAGERHVIKWLVISCKVRIQVHGEISQIRDR